MTIVVLVGSALLITALWAAAHSVKDAAPPWVSTDPIDPTTERGVRG